MWDEEMPQKRQIEEKVERDRLKDDRLRNLGRQIEESGAKRTLNYGSAGTFAR